MSEFHDDQVVPSEIDHISLGVDEACRERRVSRMELACRHVTVAIPPASIPRNCCKN
jgi:hypothetical protein